MKRTLPNPNNDNEPSKKRHKRNTTPLVDIDEVTKPTIMKSSTATSNISNTSTHSSQTDEDNECCICFDTIELPITLECGHVFCFLCLKEIRMQSSNTFNLLNFNCNDNDINLNNNNNNENIEKFSCPYCRQEFDVKVIDKATMKKTDWINNKKTKNTNKEIIIWQYSGRHNGWWAYQKGHQKQIENGFKKFVKQLKIEQEKEEKLQNQMNDNIPPLIYGFDNGNTGNNNENNNDDLGEENGLSYIECMIEIGVRKYVINYGQMIQYDFEDQTKKRKIKRQVETKYSLEKSDSLKGCAGKFFDNEKKSKENENENNNGNNDNVERVCVNE